MIVLRRLLPSVFLLGLVLLPGAVNAQRILPVYFFWGEGCPHCEREWEMWRELDDQYAIRVLDYEIWNNRENALFLGRVAKDLGETVNGVPFTVIGDQTFVGFDPATTQPHMIARIEECLDGSCPDTIAAAANAPDDAKPDNAAAEENGNDASLEVSLPFVGTVDVARYSLPALTVIIAALDGFNPCAMWTLLFLLSLLIGMENRVRRWTLGIAFLVASAAVYFVFMAAWLNLVLFLGFLWWIRAAIGVVALAGGAYYLKEYVTNKDGTCKVTGGERRQRIFQRIRAITHESSFWWAFFGIILLAFAVNLVELICSAGLPAVYTQVLALNDLAAWKYYAFLLLYISIFLLDDLFVFFVAMLTLEITGITSKYARLSHLIGGLVMLAIGLLLIFKPEWLMFG